MDFVTEFDSNLSSRKRPNGGVGWLLTSFPGSASFQLFSQKRQKIQLMNAITKVEAPTWACIKGIANGCCISQLRVMVDNEKKDSDKHSRRRQLLPPRRCGTFSFVADALIKNLFAEALFFISSSLFLHLTLTLNDISFRLMIRQNEKPFFALPPSALSSSGETAERQTFLFATREICRSCLGCCLKQKEQKRTKRSKIH